MYKSILGAFVIIEALILTTSAEAVITFERTYGSANSDEGNFVQETQDGGYIITGNTWSFGDTATDMAVKIYLIKTDAAGDTLWTQTYGGIYPDVGNSVQETRDEGYIIAGYTTSDMPVPTDVYLIKTDAAGDTVWTQTYGGPDSDEGYSVQETRDGGYIIVGGTDFYRGEYAGEWGEEIFNVYLIKTDIAGDTLWTQTYGGRDQDVGHSVQETRDGGYIIAGSTWSFGAGIFDVWLIKTDAAGDTLWTQTYGGSDWDEGYSVQETQDGGYIVVGYSTSFGTGSYDVYLIKTDAAGDTVWTQTYGGKDGDIGRSVQETQDGGFIIAGNTTSFGAGSSDVYLIKTDASGDILWTQTYGGKNSDVGRSVQETQDGGYIITGFTESFGAQGHDVYLIKTDAQGNTGVEIE